MFRKRQINDAFKRNVSKNAVESLSQIKMEDFKVANNLGIKSYQTVSSPMTGERNIESQKQEIGIADFMGIYRDECDRNYVKEFALLFENQYKGKEIDNVRDYLKKYYKDGEFDYQKYQPEKQMWSDIADIVSLGILPIGETLFGWNPITGETLTDTERGYKMMEGLVTLIPVGTAVKAVKTAAKTGSNLLLKTTAKLYLSETITDLSMYGTSCAVKDTELSPELQTALTFTAGAVAGKLSSEVLLNAKSLDLVTKGGTSAVKGASGAETWRNADGSVNYPPNNGAVPGTEVNTTLQPGKMLGRYGDPTGSSHFFTEAGADPNTLALPSNTNPANYHTYEVVKEIPNTTQSTIRDWAGSTGGGSQFDTSQPIQWYLDNGYLTER